MATGEANRREISTQFCCQQQRIMESAQVSEVEDDDTILNLSLVQMYGGSVETGLIYT
jgi:hypothetical protein